MKNIIRFWFIEHSALSLAVIADITLIFWGWITPAPQYYNENGTVVFIIPEAIENLLSLTGGITLFLLLIWGAVTKRIYVIQQITKAIIAGLIFLGSVIFFSSSHGVTISRFAGLYFSSAILLYLLLHVEDLRRLFLYKFNKVSTRESDEETYD